MKNEIVRRIRQRLKRFAQYEKQKGTMGAETYQTLLGELRAVERVPHKTINIITKYLAYIWEKEQ